MKLRRASVPLFVCCFLAGAAVTACEAPDGDGEGGDGDGDGDITIGDGDISLGDGDGNGNGGGTKDNLLGVPTNVILEPECTEDCTGFSDPDDAEQPFIMVGEGVTEEQQAALDAGGTPEGLCMSEPAAGTIFPSAWTRPRFNATGMTGPVKVTLSAPSMRHDAVFYSATAPAVMPLELWNVLSRNVFNTDVSFTVVSADSQATGTFQVAPVAAGGSMVFWGSTGTAPGERTNALYGFGVGDEGIVRVLYPGDIRGTAVDDNANPRFRDQGERGKSSCVGCHSSSPDGGAVASMDHWAFNTRVYSVEPGSEGAAPEWLTPAGAAMASMTWLGAPVFSAGDWATDARRMITTWAAREFDNFQDGKTHDGSVLSNAPTELIWINLASSAEVPVDLRTVTPDEYENPDQGLQKALVAMKGKDWEVIPRSGDTNSPVLPDWSHSGERIVYTSTDRPQDGRVGGATVVDLYSMPFNGGSGGTASPINGADSEDFEYYPDFSPDDALLAFNKLPFFETNPAREDSFDHVYYRPDSDIYVIPSGGGTATRLASNDPVCDEGSAGQLYNSWAKWAPSSAQDKDTGRTYYFLIFSTARNSPFDIGRGSGRSSPASQLYVTTVIKEADGSITSGAAIYLWNQRSLVTGTGDEAAISESLTNNVTPAWDEFKIPPVPPVTVR